MYRKSNESKNDDETLIIDEEDWNNLKSITTFKEYVNCDANIMTSKFYTITG